MVTIQLKFAENKMKLSRKKLRQLIQEMVYVNPEGEAFAPDDIKPYSFIAGDEDETISTLGSHEDIRTRKQAGALADAIAGDTKYSSMGDREEDIHKMHKDLEKKYQQDMTKKVHFGPGSFQEPRDQDTIFKNLDPDSRQAKAITNHIDKYKPQIEQVVGDWVFSGNRYHDYLEDFNRGAVISRRAGLESLLYDAYEVVLDDIPQLSRIVKIYDSKMQHRMIDAIILKIKSVIYDYLMFDRGLYDMFHDSKGDKK